MGPGKGLMKRAGFVVVVLLLFVAGLVYLLLDASEDPARRRAQGEGVPDASADRSAQAEQGSDADAELALADDRDPNRIAGPAVVVSGRVLRDGSGVGGAKVRLERESPVERTMQARWEEAQREGQPSPAIAEMETVADGSFRIRMPRRSVVRIHVWAQGSAHAFRRLLIPPVGDPDPVDIDLEAGSTLRGLVLSAAGEPVAGARVLNKSPFAEQATTVDGRFEFTELPDGLVTVEVYADGHPALRRWVTAPYEGELVFHLGSSGSVEGRIVTDREEPVAGALVRISTADPSGRSVYSFALGYTDAAGNYRLDALAPGAINGVTVQHPEFPRISIKVFPTERVTAGKTLRFDMEIESGQPLRGIVLRAEDRAPVAGAVVTLLSMGENYRGLGEMTKVAAGKDGRFLVPHVPEGTYSLEACADGYARRVRRSAQQGQPFTIDLFIDRDEVPSEQTILLEPAGGVRGRVIGARNASWINFVAAELNLNTQADDFGSFEFRAVPIATEAVVKLNQPPTESDPFEVKAGEVVEVELDAFGQGGFTGVVEDPDGNPVAGAKVGIGVSSWRGQLQHLLTNSGGWGTTTTDVDGRFRLPLPRWIRSNRGQTLTVAAAHREYSVGSVGGLAILEKGETKELRIELGPSGRVTGRVEFEDGAPVSEVRVMAQPQKSKGQAAQDIRQRRVAHTAPDGTFEIVGLAEGSYRLSVWYPEAKPIESPLVEAGREDVRVVLRRTLAISGYLRHKDGRALSSQSAKVYALVPGPKAATQHHGSIQTGGLFRIAHLEPGQYEIEVVPSQQQWQIRDSFEKVRIPPVATGTTDVVIEVSPGLGVSGIVQDPDGRRVAGAGVVAMPLKLPAVQRNNYYNQSRPACIANGRGEFEIEGVGKEELELVAVATGYRPASLRAIPGTDGIVIQLDRGEVFEGTLLQHDGTPVKRQWINIQPVSKEMQNKINEWSMRGGQSWNMFGGYQLTGTQTDDKGRFVFAGLEPGEYRFGTFWNFNGVAPRETYRTGSGKHTIQLVLPFKIKGIVVGSDSQPVQPARGQVWVNARAGDQYARGVIVGANGTFEIEGLPPGSIRLQAYASGYLPASVEVQAGAENVRIVLQSQKG